MNENTGLNKELLKDCIASVIEMAEAVKSEPAGEFKDGKLLAYNEVLSSLKTHLIPVNPDDFGLGFDIDQKLA